MSPNARAFLDVIAACEGAGYDTLYGGGRFIGYADHPRHAVTAGGYTSTAAGRYQILASTWDDFCKAAGPHDFSPASQDECALWLIDRRGATADVEAGRLEDAIAKCNKEWASLPGSPYGQPTRTLDYCRQAYVVAGGMLAGAPTQAPAPVDDESTAAPSTTGGPVPIALALLSAFGPQLAALIPQIASLFGPRGEVANRNVALAQTVVKTITDVAGQPTMEAAVDAMTSDGSVRDAVAKALVTHPDILPFVEVGGGIAAARESNNTAAALPLYRDRAFIIACLLLAIVASVIAAVVFMPVWTADNRTTVLQTVLNALFAVTGYYLGSSMGSAKKDDILSKG